MAAHHSPDRWESSLLPLELVREESRQRERHHEDRAEPPAHVADALTALRRVAVLIARGAPPAQLFTAVAAELGRLLCSAGANIVRFEDDGAACVVAAWGWAPDIPIPAGTVLSLEGRSVSATV